MPKVKSHIDCPFWTRLTFFYGRRAVPDRTGFLRPTMVNSPRRSMALTVAVGINTIPESIGDRLAPLLLSCPDKSRPSRESAWLDGVLSDARTHH